MALKKNKVTYSVTHRRDKDGNITKNYAVLRWYDEDAEDSLDVQTITITIPDDEKHPEAYAARQCELKQAEIDRRLEVKGYHRLSDVFVCWLADKEKDMDGTTYAGYMHRGRHIIDYWKDKEIYLETLTAVDLLKFYDYLLHEGSIRYPGKPLSRTTANDVRKCLVQFLRGTRIYGAKIGFDFESLKLPRTREKTAQKEQPYMTGEQVRLFLAEVKDDEFWAPMYLMGTSKNPCIKLLLLV